MTQVLTSLDGYTPADATPDNPIESDWGRLTAAYGATRTFRERVRGDASGTGTTGVDDSYVAAHFEGVGAEIIGAGMLALHAFPDDPDWTGWWGKQPPFGTPVYVLTHTAPRPSIQMQGGTTFHFRNAAIEDVLLRRPQPPAAWTYASAAASAPRAPSSAPAWSTGCTS